MRKLLVPMVCLVIFGVVAHAEEVRWLPVAASNPGLHDTMWTTDVWIYTQVADVPIQVMVAFLPTAEGTASPSEVAVELQPSEVVEINDIVGSMFGESRPGALRFRSEHPFDVQSRTFNDGGEAGSFGQGIPAVRSAEVHEGWILVGAANLPGEQGVRSNIGLVNMSADDASGTLLGFAQPGNQYLGQVRIELGPHGWTQMDIFAELGVDDQEFEHAGVVGIFHSGAVQAYLSRVDNRSGDGTYMLPFDAKSVYTIPTDWTVELTLDYSPLVTLDSLTYTGADGRDVVVESPPDLFTVTLGFMSPAEFCYHATGSATGDGGTIQVVVTRARGDDQPATSTGNVTIFGPGELEIDDCFNLY